jgi:hypothetical protein
MAYKYRSIKSLETPRPPKKSRTPMVILLCLVLLASPVLYEGGLICYGNWQSMLGGHASVQTPVLDSLSGIWREGRSQTSRRLHPMMTAGRWQPSMAVPLALVIAGLGALLLRRGH